MTTSRKSFLSFAVACIVALMAATAAFASNSADTDFTFKFSGGLPQRTEWRSKTDDTNVYMSVKAYNTPLPLMWLEQIIIIPPLPTIALMDIHILSLM